MCSILEIPVHPIHIRVTGQITRGEIQRVSKGPVIKGEVMEMGIFKVAEDVDVGGFMVDVVVVMQGSHLVAGDLIRPHPSIAHLSKPHSQVVIRHLDKQPINNQPHPKVSRSNKAIIHHNLIHKILQQSAMHVELRGIQQISVGQ